MPGDTETVDGPPVTGGPTVALPTAVLVVVATVVAALLAVWGATILERPRLPTGPPQAPPTGLPAATEFAVDGRDVSLEEFRITLAGPPFSCQKADTPPAPAFPAFVSCYYPVHKDYDGSKNSWVATTGVAVLDDAVVKPDLGETAETVFQALYAMSFTAEDHPRIIDPVADDLELALPRDRYATYSAKVEVKKKGLPTPYDRVVVAVLMLRSGHRVMVFSDFPHDGSTEALHAVTDSVASILLRA